MTVWTDRAALSDWQPPACTGWQAKSTSILVALASRFDHEGDIEALLGRFAAISELRSIRYWSTTRKRWRLLYEDASALGEPDPDARRGDFSVAELRPGTSLYFLQDENGSVDAVVQRMSVRERDAHRLVIEIENETPAYLTFMPFVPTLDARAMQVLIFIERDADRAWNYYSLMRMSGASDIFASLEKSSVNRMVALFRHYTGRPTDLEPPAAP